MNTISRSVFALTIFFYGLSVSNANEALRSIASVRAWQNRHQESQKLVDLECQLTYVGGSELHVQHGNMPLAAFAESSLLSQLHDTPMGATISIKGNTLSQSRKIRVHSVAVIDPTTRIDPTSAGINPGEKRVSLLSYTAVTGRVNSILRRNSRITIRLGMPEMNYAPLYVLVNRTADIKDLMPMLGKDVEATGTLRYPQNTQFQIMATRLDQLRETGAMRADLKEWLRKNTWKQITGCCVFNDLDHNILVRTSQGMVVKIETTFTDRIHYGDNLTVYCTQMFRDTTFANSMLKYQACAIDVSGSQKPEPAPRAFSLKEQNLLTEDAHSTTKRNTLASRARLTGVVRAKRTNNKISEYDIDCDGFSVDVFVNDSDRDFEAEPQRGDEVSFTGALTFPDIGRRKTESDLLLYVGSGADVEIQQSPLLISRQLVVTIMSIVGGVLIAGVLWVQCLRHQVGVRTESLAAVSSHLEASFESVREAILLSDSEGRVSRVNSRFLHFFGFEPKPGSPISKCLTKLSEQFSNRGESEETLQALCCDENTLKHNLFEVQCRERTLKVYSSPIQGNHGEPVRGCLWSFQDITHQRSLEAELLQAQKMEAIGQLSGGVAHDFNNLLTVVSTNLALMIEIYRHEGVDTSEFSTPMNMAIDQGAELSRQLLGFARDSELQIRCVNANEIATRVYSLVRRTIDSSIELSLLLETNALPIEVDDIRLEQVLLNLCINARDAIEGHGSISLRTSAVFDDVLGDAVLIEVEDDGQGMQPATQARIFEPFFTTKERTRGTGLGLSTALGLVQQMGGRIDLSSTWQKGTTFRILLPLSQQSKYHSDASESTLLEPASEQLHLLLVDDEEALRKAGQSLLMKLGHRVSTAGNGREAIAAIRSNEDIDMVLLDLTMPEMTGTEAYDYIQQEWPNLPVIICSGYSSFEVHTIQQEHSSVEFLPKPFKLKHLQAAIERLALVR